MDNAPDVAIDVGDTVVVPGGLTGTVKYLGGVNGKSGIFAGVELSREHAARGKNDGDVDGIRYFTTTVSGSGIFLPAHRATKQDHATFPPTPTTPSFGNLDAARQTLPTTRTPPTPSIPKFGHSVGPGTRPNFSQSVGPGARAPSPQHKQKPRGSLPRPESPIRRAPSLQPSSNLQTPGRASLKGIRSTASPVPGSARTIKPQTPGPGRAPSRSQSRQTDRTIDSGSASIPATRHAATAKDRSASVSARANDAAAAEKEALLEKRLEERDRQLKEQAASLADMESSLAELQMLMASNPDVVKHAPAQPTGQDFDTENTDVVQLRATLREKNERISTLTADFDSHRADFRSTIDALEMASTETERVYEKKVQDLLQEVEDLQRQGNDVATVAAQLKQLEDLVQELEEGLEDARRGEAEARGEVEFLRGEVERARLELRREREKGAKALKGAGAAVANGGEPSFTPGAVTGLRDIEQRDDEIRGLKAIIHSLSSGPEVGTPTTNGHAGLEDGHVVGRANDTQTLAELSHLREATEALQRERNELQGMMSRKAMREEELEREVAELRRLNTVSSTQGSHAPEHRNYHAHKSSSSTITATTVPSQRNSGYNGSHARRPDSASILPLRPTNGETHTIHEAFTADSPRDETASVSATDTDTLWCEICEVAGHDILTCSQMFGNESKDKDKGGSRAPDGATADPPALRASNNSDSRFVDTHENKEDPDNKVMASPTKSLSAVTVVGVDRSLNSTVPLPRPLKLQRSASDLQQQTSAVKTEAAAAAAAPAFPLGDGPAAGKVSGLVDMSKWCALCERDGHESVDCPFEQDF